MWTNCMHVQVLHAKADTSACLCKFTYTVCTLYNKPLCAVTACMCRYWMYAAVKAGPNGLLISNDQMRDHLFQLLAPRFFQKWKQRHQVSLPPDNFHCQTSSALGWESQQRKEAYMLSGVITRSLCTQQAGSLGWDDLLFCTVTVLYSKVPMLILPSCNILQGCNFVLVIVGLLTAVESAAVVVLLCCCCCDM